jgi:acetyl-CoA carboxylase carboxyl transferase subunit alpha
VGDRVYMLENSIYSVISPEGCAAILWKDQSKAAEAAAAMKITAQEVAQLGVVDEVLPEPLGGAHRDPDAAAEQVKAVLMAALDELEAVDPQRRVDDRMQKFLNMGVFDQI